MTREQLLQTVAAAVVTAGGRAKIDTAVDATLDEVIKLAQPLARDYDGSMVLQHLYRLRGTR